MWQKGIIMADMSMKEMLVAVSEGKVDAEVMAKASLELAKLDAKAKAKAEKAKSKKAEADAPLLAAAMEYMAGKDGVLASEMSAVLKVSVSKASSVLMALVKEGVADVSDVKVAKVGVRKSYKLV